MNHTKNYQLPQWEENDRILRTDFNDAMLAIDEELQELQDQIDTGEEALAETDQTIRADFNQIVERVDGDIAQLTPYFGTYTGTGTAVQNDGTITGKKVNLGFRPKLVIISRGWLTQSYMHYGFFVGMEPLLEDAKTIFRFTDTGFVAGTTNKDYNGKLNEQGVVYPFVAFR